ncbi:MAG: hypothetical protein ACQEQL_09285, partial [Pseudomonadota bacterium]
HAYENMPSVGIEKNDLDRAIDVISHWSYIAKKPDNEGFHTTHMMIMNTLYKNNINNFGTSSEKENWHLLTSLHPSQIVSPNNLGQIIHAIRNHVQKTPSIPTRKTTIKALHASILAGQDLTARLRHPEDFNKGVKQKDILPALKNLCDAIDLLSSEIMNLDPEITTALKNEMLGPSLNPQGLKDYFAKQNKVKYGASGEHNNIGINKELYKELINRHRAYRNRPPFWK